MLPTQISAGAAAVHRSLALRQRLFARRRWPAWIAGLAAAAAFYGSTLPVSKRSLLHSSGPLHPVVHLVLFGIIALFAAWSTDSPGVRAALCVALAVLGCATEFLEWRLYGNPLEYTDIILDAMGAVIGTGLGALTAPLLNAAVRNRSPR